MCSFSASSDVAQAVNDVDLGGMVRGDEGAEKSHQRRYQQGHDHRGQGDGHAGHESSLFLHAKDDDVGDQGSDDSSYQRQRDGFADEQAQDAVAGESQRFEQGHFAGAFPDGHRHGVGRDQQDGEDYRRADAQNEGFDVAQHLHEVELEGALGLGLGGLGRVAKLFVNRTGDAGNVLRGIDQDGEDAFVAFGLGIAFVEIGLVEIDGLGRRRGGKYAANGQCEVQGKDDALDVQPIADLPAELPGEFGVDDGAGAVMLPGFDLLRGYLKFGIDLEQFLGIGTELGEEVFRLVVLVLPAEPLLVDHLGDTGDGPDFLPIGGGQIEQ